MDMEKNNLHNYIKLCKRQDINLILNISRDISLGHSAEKIAQTYSVNKNEVIGAIGILDVINLMNLTDPINKNILVNIYEQYINNKNKTSVKNILSDVIGDLYKSGNDLENLKINLGSIIPTKFNGPEIFKKLFEQNEQIEQTGGAIKCGCCDCSKDGYVFTNEENQKCSK